MALLRLSKWMGLGDGYTRSNQLHTEKIAGANEDLTRVRAEVQGASDRHRILYLVTGREEFNVE
jgi:hypothetical protein